MSETLRKLTRTTVKVGVLGAGILMIGSSAHAADVWNTGFNSGILNGNQIKLPVQVPINVCGVAVGVIGAANASCVGGSSATIEEAAHVEGTELNWATGFNSGILNGNQIYAPIQVPVNVSSVAVGVIGAANASSVGGSSADIESARNWDNGGTVLDWNTGFNSGILNGNQAYVPIQIPINVCGVAVGVIGAANASCVGGASADIESSRVEGTDLDWNTGFNSGILNGNQAYIPIQIPINVCGVAVGVIGAANASCVGGASATNGGDDDAQWTGKQAKGADDRGYGWDKKSKESGRTEMLGLDMLTSMLPLDSLTGGLGGSPAAAPAKAAKGAKADTKSAKSTKPADARYGNWDHDDTCEFNLNSGFNSGILNGNQLVVPVQVPIDISGVAVGVIGAANAQSVGGSSASFC